MSYVVFTASVLTLMAVAAATDRNKPFKAHLDLSNTPSAVGLLFESQARSISHCGVLCSSDACCSRFNFAKSGSTPGVCRAYRTGMTSGSSGTSAVRSRTFILQGKEGSGKIRHLCTTCTTNNAAQLVLKKRRRDHVTPLLKELHWLPVKFRCQYKIAALAYRHFDGSLPPYLFSSLCTYEPSRFLRSSNEKLLKIPKRNLKSFGQRSFSFMAPSLWNSLPATLRNIPTLSQFKSQLKTFLFAQAFL